MNEISVNVQRLKPRDRSEPADVSQTANILLRCLVFLGLLATVNVGAQAGKHALDQIEPRAGVHHVDSTPCKKFELPDPIEHKCHRATSQAPVSSRPRPNEKSETTDLKSAALSPTQVESGVGEPEYPEFKVRQASRRSSFWQVFAYSGRLRN